MVLEESCPINVFFISFRAQESVDMAPLERVNTFDSVRGLTTGSKHKESHSNTVDTYRPRSNGLGTHCNLWRSEVCCAVDVCNFR